MLASAKDFAPVGATKGLSARPLETFGPVPCGNPCKLRSERVHLHHAGTKKHAFFLRRFPRTAAKAPHLYRDPTLLFGRAREGLFSEKPPLATEQVSHPRLAKPIFFCTLRNVLLAR